LVISVRGIGVLPTTAANSALGCTGFISPWFDPRLAAASCFWLEASLVADFLVELLFEVAMIALLPNAVWLVPIMLLC
jgi:hypothetical protein